MKKHVSKVVLCIVMLLAFCPLLRSHQVKADATGCFALEVSVYDHVTDEIVSDKDFYDSLSIKLYENGILINTEGIIYKGYSSHTARIMVGYNDSWFKPKLKIGSDYKAEILLPDGYQLKSYSDDGNVKKHYKISGNVLSFTYDSALDNAVSTPGMGLTISAGYWDGPRSSSGLQQTSITVPKDTYILTYGAKSFSLKASVKNGSALTYKSSKPSVIAVSKKGKITVKAPGTAKVTVKSKATKKYSGAVKKISFTVNPKKVAKVKAVSPKSGQAKVTWKKDTTVSGYEILVSEYPSFETVCANVKVEKPGVTKKTITDNLEKGKTYYVKVRAYKTVSQNILYGDYSAVATVKVK